MVSSMTALLIIAVTALFTFLTRAVPFLFFGGKKLLRPGFYFSAEYFHPPSSPFWLSTVCEILPRQRLPLVSPKLLRF